MKKLNVIASAIMFVLFVWAMFSVFEIGFKSINPEAEYAPSNLFVILFPNYNKRLETYENPNLRVDCGEIACIYKDKKEIVFMLTDGTFCTAEVEDTDKFDPNGYYAIFFDRMGTKNVNDDIVIKTFLECW